MTMTPASDLAAAARGGAIAALPDRLVFSCRGRDAVDLLGRLSTADLAPLARGESVRTIFLTPTGRVLHRVLLIPLGDSSLRAIAEAGSESFPEWIDRYTFAEDCRVEAEPGVTVLGAWGEQATSLGPQPLAHDGVVALDGDVAFTRHDWRALPAAIASGPAEQIESLLRSSGLVRLDDAALLQLRVEHGEPEAGAELTGERFPLEAGLIDEISFTKGCYTGQEVVARQDSYGKVARRLVGLAFETRPAVGDELADAKGCTVTSVAPFPVRLPEGERVLALGYVPAKSSAPGSELATASGLRARVVELPVVSG